MDWLNIHSSTLDAQEFLCSDTVSQGTWLKLLRYCIGQENAGVMPACKAWTDANWQRMVGARKAEVLRPTRLWCWIGEDLHVWSYPAERETEVKAKRAAAQATNQKRWGQRIAERPAERPAEPDAERLRKGKGKGKGKENGMEEEVKTALLIPSLEVAQRYFAGNGSGYSSEDVEAAYVSLQATRHPGGWWQFGKSMVTDWRMGLSSRLSLMAKKNPAPPPALTAVPGAPPPCREGEIDWEAMRG